MYVLYEQFFLEDGEQYTQFSTLIARYLLL